MGLRMALKAIFNSEQWTDTTIYPGYGGVFESTFGMNHYSTYLTMYRNSLPIRAVVSFKADNLAALPMKVYKRLDDDLREALNDHGLALTLKEPNLEDTAHTFVRDLYTDLQLFDCTYWKKIRVGNKLFLQRLFPDAMEPLGGNVYAPDEWRELQRDGTYKMHKRADVFWLHGYGGMSGVSPMETLRREMELDEAEANYRLRSSKKGWRTEGVIERPKTAGNWTPAARKNFMESMSARYSGDGAGVGKPLLLEEDMHWVADPAKDGSTAYIASRSFTIKQVCLAFHMAPQVLGLEGAPYASVLEYKNQLYQIILGPDANFIEQGVEKQLLPEFPGSKDVYVEFNMDAALRGDPAQQAAIAASAVGVPYYTPDEWRAKILNLGPMPAPPVPAEDAGTGAWYDGLPMSGGKPGPAPDPTSPNRTPQPSDFTISPLTLSKGVVYGEPTLDKRAELRVVVREGLSKLVDKMHSDYNEKGVLDSKTWVGALAGELQLKSLMVSQTVGEMAADSAGVEYNASQTVAYWGKAAKAQAKTTVDGIQRALEENDAEEVWSAIGGQLKAAADTLVVRASNWSLLELGRQTGTSQVAGDFVEKAMPTVVKDRVVEPQKAPDVNVTVNVPPIDLPQVNLTVEPQAINVTTPDVIVEPTTVNVTPELEVNLPETRQPTRKIQRVIRDENNLITSIETVEE